MESLQLQVEADGILSVLARLEGYGGAEKRFSGEKLELLIVDVTADSFDEAASFLDQRETSFEVELVKVGYTVDELSDFSRVMDGGGPMPDLFDAAGVSALRVLAESSGVSSWGYSAKNQRVVAYTSNPDLFGRVESIPGIPEVQFEELVITTLRFSGN